MNLKFNDGEQFDLSGPYRIEQRQDGYYVVGDGRLIPVESLKEGQTLVKILTEENT